MGNPSLKDVAQEADVSTATVSRILNNDGNFSETTRARVLAAVERLNYVPRLRYRNALKHFSRKIGQTGVRRTNNIALIWKRQYMEQIAAHIMWGEALDEMCLATQEIGFSLLITLVSDQTSIPQPVLEEKVDAAIVRLDADEPFLRRIRAHVPVVLIGASGQTADVSSVRVNEYGAHFKALKHFVDLGHRRIAYFIQEGSHRHALVMKAMEELGVEAVPAWTDPVSVDYENLAVTINEAIDRYLAGPKKATAILSDEGSGARFTYELLRRGINVPKDISVAVIGDNLWPLSTSGVTMTATRYPMKEMGRWSVNEAVRLVEEQSKAVQTLEIDATLMPRESTGPAPAE